jgi:hypothetical protein
MNPRANFAFGWLALLAVAALVVMMWPHPS